MKGRESRKGGEGQMGAQPQWSARIERSRRSTIGIRITEEGEVVVRAPLHTPVSEIRRVLDKKRDWIEKTLEKVREREQAPKLTEPERQELARLAKAVIPPRVAEWAKRAGISYGRITLRLQKTRWGSCSAKGNLNFNCLLAVCPEEVLDYVIVHELCHRKELNHSKRFWAEVERILPGYRAPRKWLKTEGQKLIARVR